MSHSFAVKGGGIFQDIHAYLFGSGDTAASADLESALSTERVAQIEREVRDSYSSKKSISPKDQEIVTDLAVAFAIVKESSEIQTQHLISWGLSNFNLQQFWLTGKIPDVWMKKPKKETTLWSTQFGKVNNDRRIHMRAFLCLLHACWAAQDLNVSIGLKNLCANSSLRWFLEIYPAFVQQRYMPYKKLRAVLGPDEIKDWNEAMKTELQLGLIPPHEAKIAILSTDSDSVGGGYASARVRTSPRRAGSPKSKRSSPKSKRAGSPKRKA